MGEPSAQRGCSDQHHTPPSSHSSRVYQSTDCDGRDDGATDEMRHHQDRHDAAEHMWCAKQARHQAARNDHQQPGPQRPRAAECPIG